MSDPERGLVFLPGVAEHNGALIVLSTDAARNHAQSLRNAALVHKSSNVTRQAVFQVEAGEGEVRWQIDAESANRGISPVCAMCLADALDAAATASEPETRAWVAGEAERLFWWAKAHSHAASDPQWPTGKALHEARDHVRANPIMVNLAHMYRAIAEVIDLNTRITSVVLR